MSEIKDMFSIGKNFPVSDYIRTNIMNILAPSMEKQYDHILMYESVYMFETVFRVVFASGDVHDFVLGLTKIEDEDVYFSVGLEFLDVLLKKGPMTNNMKHLLFFRNLFNNIGTCRYGFWRNFAPIMTEIIDNSDAYLINIRISEREDVENRQPVVFHLSRKW
jgi:hypothetical protein